MFLSLLLITTMVMVSHKIDYHAGTDQADCRKNWSKTGILIATKDN